VLTCSSKRDGYRNRPTDAVRASARVIAHIVLIESFDDKHVGKYGIFHWILFDLYVVHFPVEARIGLAEYVAIENSVRTEHFVLFEPCLLGIRCGLNKKKTETKINSVPFNLVNWLESKLLRFFVNG